MKDSSDKTITIDDYLWWLNSATEAEGFDLVKGNKMDVPKLVKSLLLVLGEQHFDAKGNLAVNQGNRPYGYSIEDFSQTVPG